MGNLAEEREKLRKEQEQHYEKQENYWRWIVVPGHILIAVAIAVGSDGQPVGLLVASLIAATAWLTR